MPSLIAVLGLNGSSFKAGLDRAVNQADAAGSKIGSSLSQHVGGAIAGVASIAALEQLAHKTLEFAEHVHDLSGRLGISTDAVQAWDYALSLSGSSIDSAAGFFEKLAKARQKALSGNGDSIAAFHKLGVAVEDLKSKRLEDIGLQISEAFQAGDPQKLISDLREVGGRGAGEMVAAFRDGFAELVNSAKSAGVVMDEEIIGRLKETGDKMKTLGREFMVGFAPVLDLIGKGVESLWRGMNSGVRFAVGLVTGGVKGVEDLVNEYDEQNKERDKAAEERRTKKKAPLVGGGDEGLDEKAMQAAERSAEKILRLKEELFRLQQETDLKSLSKEEKVEELVRRRADILEAMRRTTSEEGKLNAAIDIEKTDQQLAAIKADKENKEKTPKLEVNSLQKVGAYVSDPTRTAVLDTAKQSEGHLREIRKGIAKLAGPSTGKTEFD